MQVSCTEYIILKFGTSPEKKRAFLAIPETCADKIMSLYHTVLFVGLQGIIKTYLTIGNILSIPGLIQHLRLYLKGCHICQL